MSASTPDDLATTFRSLTRRRRESIGDANPAHLSGFTAELQRQVEGAARAVGSAADPEAVAAAIRARPPDAWDDATLDTLRRHALEAGAVLRRMSAAAAAETGADDER